MGTEWRAATRAEEGTDVLCGCRLCTHDADRNGGGAEFFNPSTDGCAGFGAGERNAGKGDGLERCPWQAGEAGNRCRRKGVDGCGDRGSKGFQYLFAATQDRAFAIADATSVQGGG